MMKEDEPSKVSLSTGTDLAFALVVFISYFSAFSTTQFTSFFMIFLIIFLGIAYLSAGVYGFAFARRSGSRTIKFAYFLVLFILGGLIIHYGKGAGFTTLILLPVVAHTVMLLDQDWMLFSNISLVVVYVVSVYSYSQSISQVWDRFPVFFVAQVFILIFTQMAVTEQKAREKLEQLAGELSEANKHLSMHAEKVHDLAIAQERNRFAREIHDGLGHYLTTINMQINAASAIIKNDPEKSISMLQKAQKMTSEALVDVRNSVYELRRDGIELEDLVVSLHRLVNDLQPSNHHVGLNIIGIERAVSPQVSLTIYRAAQELINNSLKYAKSEKIDLTLDFSNLTMVHFTGRDDGIGSVEFKKGFGLLGIEERAKLLGGSMEIVTYKGKGFRVHIGIPG